MGDPPKPTDMPRQRHTREYEDPHFHDEDEVAPVEDGEARGPRTPRSPTRKKKFSPRRYEED
jgi:hypothetical protein